MSRSRSGSRHWLALTKSEVSRRNKLDASRERTRLQRDAALDPICVCGWMTALDVCPKCRGTRTEGGAIDVEI